MWKNSKTDAAGTAWLIWNKNDCVLRKNIANMFCRYSAQSLNPTSVNEFLAQAVQGRSASLPLPCCIGSFTHAQRKSASYKCHDEHDDKGYVIASLVSNECIEGRYRKEIKGRYAQSGREDRRTSVGTAYGEYDSEQIDHGNVHKFQKSGH